MTITSASVRAYLNRDFDDYREWKKLTNRQLTERMRELPIRPPIWHKLTRDQKICFLIGVETGGFCFWNDMGTGKTLLALALMLYFIRAGEAERFLVLVPSRNLKYEWEDEILKHTPHTDYLILDGPTEKKWEALRETEAPIVIETYSGMDWLVCEKMEVENKKKKRMEVKFKAVPRKVTELCRQFDGFVADDSKAISNHDTLAWRVCKKMSKEQDFVFVLNGTPFGRNPEALWSQMFLVDHGETLGETLGLFRAAFFVEQENPFSKFPEYKFDKAQEDLLHDIIANRSIRFTADESDLPPCRDIVKTFRLGTDAKSLYEEAVNAIQAARGNFTESENVFHRMRQLSSGYVGYYDDAEGRRAQYEFEDNPKLELFLNMVGSIYEEHKFLAFHDYIFTGSMLERELEKLGVPTVRLYGGTDDPKAVMASFKKDKKIRGLIIQNRMTRGPNLQVARYGFFYESPVPYDLRLQAERRWIRQYSPHKTVFKVDLIARNTADQQILDYHQEGKDLLSAIIEGNVAFKRRKL